MPWPRLAVLLAVEGPVNALSSELRLPPDVALVVMASLVGWNPTLPLRGESDESPANTSQLQARALPAAPVGRAAMLWHEPPDRFKARLGPVAGYP